MDANEKLLTQFTTRTRQMILKFNELKEENQGLYSMVDERDVRIGQLEAQLTQLRNDYDSLKMARMIEVSDTDLDSAQKRLAKLIRDVNKCITLLSEK